MEQLKFDFMTDFRTHKKYKSGVFLTKNELEAKLISEGKDKIYKVLSFGGGTQSSHLLEDHFQGKIHYDFIIFSDTGAEPDFIHEQVKWWMKRQQEVGNNTPFILTHHSSMEKGLEEMVMRYINTDYQRFQLPVYCNKIVDGEEIAAGIMPRQCTVDFKIVPVKQAARKLVLQEHGLGDRQRMPSNIGFIIDIGFSVDEINRINLYQSPQFKYMYLAYPLVEGNLTTAHSIEFLEKNNMPNKRSRCYLCPFNCDKKGIEWMEVIQDEPLSFLKACYIDTKLREVQASGIKNMKSVPYLHYKRIPLQDAYPISYLQIKKEHLNDLKKWISDWDKLIDTKYKNGSKICTNMN